MQTRNILAPLLVAVAVAVAACSTEPIKKVKPGLAANEETAAGHLAQMSSGESDTYVSHTTSSWLPMKRFDPVEESSLKRRAEKTIIYSNEQFRDLSHLVGEVSLRAGIPISMSPDVQLLATNVSQQGAPGGMQRPLTAPPASPGQFPGAPGGAPAPGTPFGAPGLGGLGAQQQSALITASSPYRSQYSGPLSEYLNIVSAHYGLSWRASEHTLLLFYLDTKTFRINAVPGDAKLSASVSGGAQNSSSSGGGGGQSTSSSTTGVSFDGLSVWTALESSVGQLLTPMVGKVYVSPATGTITVKDRPEVLARVETFIKEQNESLARQVAVNVRVLSVELNDGEEFGLNWDAIYENVAESAGFAVKTAFPSSTGAANVVFSSPAGSPSLWAGSKAIISALSTQGRVSELTSATLLTTNNQPAPVNIGRRVSYLASSSTTATPDVGATTALTPGTVDTGFSMTLVPHVLDDSNLMLQYSVDLSSLIELKNITSGTSMIQAPDVSTSNFIQRIRMSSGEMLAVAGFDQSQLSAVAQGVGSPNNFLMGSNMQKNKRSMLVILVQPVIAPNLKVAKQ